MGLLGNLLRPKNLTVEEWSTGLRAVFGGRQTASGVTVNESSAMRFVTVYSCQRVLAETLGSLPLVTFKGRPGGGSDKARDHPNYALLHDLPNDEMTSQTWRETQMGHIVLSGNTYSVITFNGRGQPVDLYPVPWNQVQVQRNLSTRKLEYHITDRDKPDIFPPEKILHIPGLGFDGIRGYSPIQMNAQAIGLGMAAAEFAEHFYGQGMNVGTVVEYPGALSDPAFARLKAYLDEEGAGLGKSWKPMLLEEGAKLNRIPMPLSDAQFIETRRFSREEICGLFRVPPHMIADLSRSTNNNIEHQSLEFVMYTMLPYVTRWEQSINWKLFSKREREQGYYVKFNLSALLRGDAKARADFYHIMRQDGIYNADEIREFEEMNPQPNGTGKPYLANGNLRDVAQLMIASAGKDVTPVGGQNQGA